MVTKKPKVTNQFNFKTFKFPLVIWNLSYSQHAKRKTIIESKADSAIGLLQKYKPHMRLKNQFSHAQIETDSEMHTLCSFALKDKFLTKKLTSAFDKL